LAGWLAGAGAGAAEIEISRTVRVTAVRESVFMKAMVAKGQIDLSGNNVKTDSFDSSNPAYSTNGQYDSAKAKDKGDVATTSGLLNSLSVGNADIWGCVLTGLGGSTSVGANGSVGSKAWHQAGKKGIEPGFSRDDMNMSFPDVAVPFEDNYRVPAGDPLTISASGNWKVIGDLTQSLVVKSNVQAIVLVTGNINLSGNNDKIEIQPGGSLRLYVAGEKAAIKGQGVMNQSGNAANFYYFGLPGNKSLALAGNAAFVGGIYAPNAAFSLGGGGNDTKDFIGASVTDTVKMNGHFNFHYDENLGRVGPDRRYILTSWNEIAPADAVIKD
jgi:hypothetical protein